MKIYTCFQLFTALFVLLTMSVTQTRAAGRIDAAYESIVDVVFKRMSQADKATELHVIRPNELFVNGKLSHAKCRELIPNGIGQLCQFVSTHSMLPIELGQCVILAAASASDIRLRGIIELKGEKQTLNGRTLLITN